MNAEQVIASWMTFDLSESYNYSNRVWCPTEPTANLHTPAKIEGTIRGFKKDCARCEECFYN